MNKILIVSNTSWSLFNFRLHLARSLKKAGHEVILVAPHDEYSNRLSLEFEYHDIFINNKGTNPIEDIKTTLSFYKLYKKIKPDLALHFTIKPNIYGTIACNLLGVKTINNIAGLGTLYINQNYITKLSKWLYKHSQNKSNKVFFQNKEDFNLFIKENLIDQSKCDVLPGSGVDTKRFVPIVYKKENKKFIFLLVARMLWSKGIGEYVKAAEIIKSKYPDTEFQLLGFLDTDNRNAVSKQQMKNWESEGYISYLGTSDNVEKVIAKADCIVLPSFYREGTPRILLESASMAKPIITTDNVGCRDVVDDGINGYICEVRNAQDLAKKMENMLKLSFNERSIMGQAGRKKMIDQFEESIVIKKYLESIENLMQGDLI